MRGVGENPRDRAIAQSVAYLARALEVETVAEGIETEEQLRYARETGFTNVQGFVLSRPVPIGELQALLNRNRADVHDMAALIRQRRLA